LGLDVFLKLLGDVFFQPETPSLKLNLESSLSLLQALAELLLQPCANPAAQLLFSLGEHRLMAVFKTGDLELFHLGEPLFHLVLEVGLDGTESFLERLIVLKAETFLLDGQPPFVFFLELRFNRGLDGFFALLQTTVLFDTVLFVQRLHLSLKTEIQLMTHPCFLVSKGVTLHGFQFGFHGGSQIPFKSVKGEFVLGGKVTCNVGFHRLHALGDGLLAQSAFSSEVSSQPLFLAESCLRSHGLIKRRGARRCELRTQSSERHSLICLVPVLCGRFGLTVVAFARAHWNPIRFFMGFSS
jgi:hypothetical protein